MANNSNRLESLVTEYKEISSSQGARIAAQLVNALRSAERVESDHHWGIFANDVHLKRKSRLNAWILVGKQRQALDSLVTKDLVTIVKKVKDLRAPDPLIALLEQDVVLKSGIAGSIAKGTLSEDETLALLAIWAASPMGI